MLILLHVINVTTLDQAIPINYKSKSSYIVSYIIYYTSFKMEEFRGWMIILYDQNLYIA